MGPSWSNPHQQLPQRHMEHDVEPRGGHRDSQAYERRRKYHLHFQVTLCLKIKKAIPSRDAEDIFSGTISKCRRGHGALTMSWTRPFCLFNWKLILSHYSSAPLLFVKPLPNQIGARQPSLPFWRQPPRSLPSLHVDPSLT